MLRGPASVWTGRIYYTPVSFFDIIPDHSYKQKVTSATCLVIRRSTDGVQAITLYDSRRAPILDHYRLRVPRYRMLLEFMSFAIVFVLMLVVLSSMQMSFLRDSLRRYLHSKGSRPDQWLGNRLHRLYNWVGIGQICDDRGLSPLQTPRGLNRDRLSWSTDGESLQRICGMVSTSLSSGTNAKRYARILS